VIPTQPAEESVLGRLVYITITAASNPMPNSADRSADQNPSLFKALASRLRVSAPALRPAEGDAIEIAFNFSLLSLLLFILRSELPVSLLDRETRAFSPAYTYWRTKLLREVKISVKSARHGCI
jgi:hypothetical protein